jgi:hypothetical protein
MFAEKGDGFTVEELQTLPFAESFWWDTLSQVSGGRFSTSNINETKILFEKVLHLLKKQVL